jgi:hypothetical protein
MSQSNRRQITRPSTPGSLTFLPRFDGRSDIARRHKVIVRQLLGEWRQRNPGLRTTKAERDEISRVGWQKLMGEIAVRRFIMGEIDAASATRASSVAMRSERAFLRRVVNAQEPV